MQQLVIIIMVVLASAFFGAWARKIFFKRKAKGFMGRIKNRGYQVPGSLTNPVWPRPFRETMSEEDAAHFRNEQNRAEEEMVREDLHRNVTNVTLTSSFGVNQFQEKVSDVEIAQKLKEFVKPQHLLDEMLARVESGTMNDIEKNLIADIATHCLLRDAEQEKDPVKKKEKLTRFEAIRQNMGKK